MVAATSTVPSGVCTTPTVSAVYNPSAARYIVRSRPMLALPRNVSRPSWILLRIALAPVGGVGGHQLGHEPKLDVSAHDYFERMAGPIGILDNAPARVEHVAPCDPPFAICRPAASQWLSVAQHDDVTGNCRVHESTIPGSHGYAIRHPYHVSPSPSPRRAASLPLLWFRWAP